MKVGYQNRDGTYTGRLAYVIYYDNKGKLRKEASWQSWRDNKIEPDEFDNVPTEGFVLNKKVGGYASDWGNFRQAYVRVYDPRGFEFEITVPNLLYILENTSSIKGKGLEGEFVYAWEGTELVLLPTAAPDYSELTKLNEQRFKNETVKARDLKIGATYLHNDNSEWVYMGRFDYYETGYDCHGQWFSSDRKAREYAREHGFMRTGRNWYGTYETEDVTWGTTGSDSKRHVFYNRCSKKFECPRSLSGLLIATIAEEPATDYAELFDQLESTTSYSPYDASKDVKVFATVDEVREYLSDYLYGKTFHCDDGPVDIAPSERGMPPDLYRCDFWEDSQHVKLMNHFEMVDIPAKYGGGTYKAMTPLPLEDIVSELHIYYTKQYLANGKYYRTVW